MYNYIKIKDACTSQLLSDSIPDRIVKDWKLEKKSSDLYNPNSNIDNKSGTLDMNADEETPLIPSARTLIGRSQLGSHHA